MPIAVVTGASRGLGLALAQELARQGWQLVLDARNDEALHAGTGGLTGAVARAGDVTSSEHRRTLASLAADLGGADLLVNNASTLGPSPMPALADLSLDQLANIYQTNVFAPLALTRLLLPQLAGAGTVVNISSDAAVNAYEGWGGYGSSKAALDQLTAILAAENPALKVYSFDPGDMRTQMHQEAFPGEDISDRPEPATVVPSLLRLLSSRPPSGRYRAADLGTTDTLEVSA